MGPTSGFVTTWLGFEQSLIVVCPDVLVQYLNLNQTIFYSGSSSPSVSEALGPCCKPS